MRLFIGIALAETVVRELEAAVECLRSSGGAAATLRWTAPDSWHITLQFLGNATPEQYGCLMTRLCQVRGAPVRVESGALGCFERSGILFAALAPAPALETLAQRVVALTARCGFVAETRPFRPHITLARAKNGGSGAVLRALVSLRRSQPPFSCFTAKEFLLFESYLGPQGVRYEVRARFPLAGD